MKRDERYVRKATLKKFDEKVKALKDDVKPENGVSEAKTSFPFSGFDFSQLSEPLIFPELRSGA